MVSIIGFLSFMIFLFIVSNQTVQTHENEEDIEPAEASSSSVQSNQRPEETPTETHPSSFPLPPCPPNLTPPSSIPIPPRPPNCTQPSSSSLPTPERQVPSNSPQRRRSNVNPEASSSSSGHGNPFLNMAPRHPDERRSPELVPEPHRMDALSWVALGYCFTAGLEFNAIYAQVDYDPRNLTLRFVYISMLTMSALCSLIAANAIYARTNPRLAFLMDRYGAGLVLITSVLAANPALPIPYALLYVLVLIMVYALHHLDYYI